MLLSFIIPTYNVSNKIELCLKSISHIPLRKKDYEIIVIDDSSTDDTVEIAEKFLKENNLEYTLLRQNKSGQASARNKGLGVSKGKYIWMIDSDDEIISDSEIWDNLINNTKVELITFNYEEIFPSKAVLQQKIQRKQYMSGIDFLANSVGGSYLWNKIYHRNTIQNIRFIEGSTHIEDMCFNVHAITNISSILCLPVAGYKYYRYPKRKLRGKDLLTERCKANSDSFRAYQAIRGFALRADRRTQEILYNILSFEILAHLYSIFKNDDYSVLLEYKELYRSMGLYPCVKVKNTKANLFRIIINNTWLTKVVHYFMKSSKCLGSWNNSQSMSLF